MLAEELTSMNKRLQRLLGHISEVREKPVNVACMASIYPPVTNEEQRQAFTEHGKWRQQEIRASKVIGLKH